MTHNFTALREQYTITIAQPYANDVTDFTERVTRLILTASSAPAGESIAINGSHTSNEIYIK